MILGKKLIRLAQIDSTNDEARRLIKTGAGEGLVVVAESQTAGRGKPGNVWFSPPGNLYLSAVVTPRKNPQELTPITLLAALAAKRAIETLCPAAVVIKWPNDLLVGGKKIGGILTERVASGHIIIGLGINLISGQGWSSLHSQTGKKIDLESLLKALLAELERAYLAYLAKVC